MYKINLLKDDGELWVKTYVNPIEEEIHCKNMCCTKSSIQCEDCILANEYGFTLGLIKVNENRIKKIDG